jgi:hypothetical protein
MTIIGISFARVHLKLAAPFSKTIVTDEEADNPQTQNRARLAQAWRPEDIASRCSLDPQALDT